MGRTWNHEVMKMNSSNKAELGLHGFMVIPDAGGGGAS
jgi:hypothetical protein